MSIRWHIAQRAEQIWWKRYLRKQSPDEYRAWKKQYWNQFLQQLPEALNIRPNNSIADLACGPAGIFLLFPENNITAVDPLIDQYRRQLAAHFDQKQYPHTEFITARLEDFQSPKKFDFLFCINGINHVQNMPRALLSIRQLAHPQSQLIISTDVHQHSLLHLLFRLLPGDILHPQQLSVASFETALQQTGWHIKKRSTLKKGWIFQYDVWICRPA